MSNICFQNKTGANIVARVSKIICSMYEVNKTKHNCYKNAVNLLAAYA